MLKREVVIINKLGLHARAAAKFVTLASRFDADIRLLRNGREVNGKSIMGVMMLAAACGTR
ncbi:MAG: HPr family phosphocarrier protein, partial [Candidatus Competibacteraceae bacterium]|nr:HPr family phosphocarrier protein [Candidatus Competibacteraceae bacterium]